MKAENKDAIGFVGVGIIDVDLLARNWWVVLLRGIAGIVFGILTFFLPEISLAALVLVFGAYSFADGVLAIISAIRGRENDRWWVLLLEGLAGVAAGVITLFWPGITALALLYVIAAWALVTGGLEIAAAIRLRKVITGEWLLILAGVASVAFGILLALFPGPGALAVVLWIGAYALVSGALLLALAFKLRSWNRTHTSPQRMAHGMA
jgi:uncharacterized membrane protein HdeD (DUF308 family)